MADKDRFEGKVEEAKGSVKKGVGEVTGDEKLKTEGTMDKAKGKLQDAWGQIKDAVRDATKKD